MNWKMLLIIVVALEIGIRLVEASPLNVYVINYTGKEAKYSMPDKIAKSVIKKSVLDYASIGVTIKPHFKANKSYFRNRPALDEERAVFGRIRALSWRLSKHDGIIHAMVPPFDKNGLGYILGISVVGGFDGFGINDRVVSMCSNLYFPFDSDNSKAQARYCMDHEMGHTLGAVHDPLNSCTMMDTYLFQCLLARIVPSWSVASIYAIKLTLSVFHYPS